MEEYISNYYLDNVKFELTKENKERIAVGGDPGCRGWSTI